MRRQKAQGERSLKENFKVRQEMKCNQSGVDKEGREKSKGVKEKEKKSVSYNKER